MITTRFKIANVMLLGLTAGAACNDAEFSSKNKARPVVAIEADGKPEIIQEFSTGGFASVDTFTFSASNTLLSKDLKLENVYSERSRDFRQIDRTPITKLYKQGAAGTPITETFNQGNFGVVDIQLVIDNSGSMSNEQNNLSTKLAALLTEIANADWQINVTTTDGRPGFNQCSRALIKKGQANAADAFRVAVTAGIDGDGNEQGVLRAAQGLQCNAPAWVRANSSLAVLWVTDEDNCSNGNGCPGTLGADPNYIRTVVTGMGRTVGTNARFYGIYRIPGDTTCTTAPTPANQYHALVTGSAGAAGSICANDYTTTLQAISRNIASTLRAQFTLRETPDAGSLVVKVNGVQKTTGFTLAANVLTFSEVPPANATIEVSYVKGRQPQLKEFALDEKPAAGTLKVLVDMVEVKAGFTVATGPDRVIFDAAPAASADIRFMFRRDTALLRDFSLVNSDPVNSTMKVFVDSQEVKDFTYDAATKVLRLAAAPLDLAVVRASFKNLDGPQLSYPLPTPPSNVQDFRAIDKDTKAPIRVEFKAGSLEVHPDDHRDGRVIVVSYETIDSYKTEIRLPRIPISGSVVLDTAPDTCSLASGNIAVNGDILEVNCDIADVADFAGSYRYEVDVLSSFTVQGVREPEKGTWTVTVEGEPRTDYVREGTTIKFDPATLPRRGTVSVKFTPGE